MADNLESRYILGVRIDKVTLNQASKVIWSWIAEKSTKLHIIVTPNFEFLIKASTDPEFREILNTADLSIPDSSRIGWLRDQLQEKNQLKRVVKWFTFPFSAGTSFPVTTGIDLMLKLCGEASVQGATIGLLGGKDRVAEQAAECLKKSYPELKISFAESGGNIDKEGNSRTTLLKPCNILFTAFGQVKQEKFLARNKSKLNCQVAMGVGGAFDYISGQIPRAPLFLRKIGLEWLFRLVVEPWRIKRQLAIFKFILRILIAPHSLINNH